MSNFLCWKYFEKFDQNKLNNKRSRVMVKLTDNQSKCKIVDLVNFPCILFKWLKYLLGDQTRSLVFKGGILVRFQTNCEKSYKSVTFFFNKILLTFKRLYLRSNYTSLRPTSTLWNWKCYISAQSRLKINKKYKYILCFKLNWINKITRKIFKFRHHYY